MISIFDLFSIGLGPSSSHTVGPMRAAARFSQQLLTDSILPQVNKVKVEVFGSLAHTGHGHATDKAILLGLENNLPKDVDPDHVNTRYQAIHETHLINLSGKKFLPFEPATDLVFNYEDLLPIHTNGMRYQAFDEQNNLLLSKDYYSIGGGFIISSEEKLANENKPSTHFPYPFDTASELLALCQRENKTIAEIVFANEASLRPEAEVRQGILKIASVMEESIQRGCTIEGILPGGSEVKRRAPAMASALKARHQAPLSHKDIACLDWLNVYAIAVNEENAAGSRVVTAPTNGAAGVLPAVLLYYKNFYNDVNEQNIIDYLLTAAAIAALFKKGASISAAEVGCQGEVGVACSMAAGALTAILGGSVEQVESAAEIAMEHNLGLTCDPIGGLVQIPCIERNAVGATKAVNIARLALMESGTEKKISLDKVIETMRRTGLDMSHHYKETALGGLAKIKVNVVEC